jgi:hypothetical protein
MRLPGTFNIGYNNDLLPIHAIAAARRERRASELSEANAASKKKKPDSRTPDAAKKDKSDKNNKIEDGFTKKEDKKLLKLKTDEKKTWKDISAEMGKTVSEIKERWKTIRPDKEGGEKDKGDGKKDEKKQEESNKKEKHKNDKKKALMELADDGCLILEPDEHFSFEEVRLAFSWSFASGANNSQLIILANVVQEEVEEMWGRVSVRFWELTDREVHPWDLREKVTGEYIE